LSLLLEGFFVFFLWIIIEHTQGPWTGRLFSFDCGTSLLLPPSC